MGKISYYFSVFAGFLLLASLLAGSAVLGYLALTLPVSRDLVREPSRPSLVLLAADGEAFASRGTLKTEPVALERLPPDLVNAVLAIEDRRFYDHPGLDWRGVGRALLANLRAGEVREGGSTITQQLAKVMFLPPDRTFERKLQELMIALWLERNLTKDEILERYLNRIYLGAGAYGVEAAARRYFGKPARDLDLSESAMIAGLIRAPSVLTPTRDPEAARERSSQVLTAMVEAGLLDAKRAAAARQAPARLAVPADRGSGRNYFADWVAETADRLIGPVAADFTLRTTLRPEFQALAEQVVAEYLAAHGEALGVSQAALVALSLDGAVLAMVGGRSYAESQFNRATQARRQPGSLFKLFVYLAALEAGFGPDTILPDQPITIDEWQPQNYDGRYRGPVSLRDAFAQSINTVAVRLSEAVGRDKIIAVARDLGVTSELTSEPSLALGSSETILLEMTAAYGALAAGRLRLEPYGIEAIEGPGEGLGLTQPFGEAPPGGRFAWPREEMLDLLRAAVETGTGRAAQLPYPVAGKTGTSQDHRDAWFVGFTSGLVVGVWVGNDDNAPMNEVTGGKLPARIWRDFVVAAEQQGGVPVAEAKLDAFAGLAGHRSVPPAGLGAGEEEGELSLSELLHGKRAVPLLEGVPEVLDSGALAFGPDVARLMGVRGEKGRFIGELQQYIGGRPVTCRPFDAASYSCEVGGYDLSEVVLFNGGGRSAPDAPPFLKAAETHARQQGLGVWGR
ncbi:MAG: PBP1A family penicillin-binding protein [Rhodospirillales bacterium]|nr:PBP1A family penicillin-binding protein [Rhodospirillales bacterium]